MNKTLSVITLSLCMTGLAHAKDPLSSDGKKCEIIDKVVNEMNITLNRDLKKIKVGEELGSEMMINFSVNCRNISSPGISNITPYIHIKEIAESTTLPGSDDVYNTNTPGIGIKFTAINSTSNDGHPELLSQGPFDNVSANNTGTPIYNGGNQGNQISVTGNNDITNNIYPPLKGK